MHTTGAGIDFDKKKQKVLEHETTNQFSPHSSCRLKIGVITFGKHYRWFGRRLGSQCEAGGASAGIVVEGTLYTKMIGWAD